MKNKKKSDEPTIQNYVNKESPVELPRRSLLKGAIASLTIIVQLVLVSNVFADSPSFAFNRLNQGSKWTSNDWKTFYSQDQGSLIMPYSWMVALKEVNGQYFLRDSLTRYGYLPNPKSSRNPKVYQSAF